MINEKMLPTCPNAELKNKKFGCLMTKRGAGEKISDTRSTTIFWCSVISEATVYPDLNKCLDPKT